MPVAPVDLLRGALASAMPPPIEPGDTTVHDHRPIAIGWATVELDRAAQELATDLGIEPATFVPAPDSETLGAWARVARAALPGGIAVAILEPNTEGRLAGILARHGEGPAAIWLATVEAGTGDGSPPAVETRDGPFGRERRLGGERPDRFLVERPAGTIAP